jgi:Ankyrin repeats (many copies)
MEDGDDVSPTKQRLEWFERVAAGVCVSLRARNQRGEVSRAIYRACSSKQGSSNVEILTGNLRDWLQFKRWKLVGKDSYEVAAFDANSVFFSGPNVFGGGPLHVVANIPCAKILLENGANVNQIDLLGRTPLHCLAESKNYPCVEALADLFLQYGADPTIKDLAGSTPVNCLMTDMGILREEQVSILMKVAVKLQKASREIQEKKLVKNPPSKRFETSVDSPLRLVKIENASALTPARLETPGKNAASIKFQSPIRPNLDSLPFKSPANSFSSPISPSIYPVQGSIRVWTDYAVLLCDVRPPWMLRNFAGTSADEEIGYMSPARSRGGVLDVVESSGLTFPSPSASSVRKLTYGDRVALPSPSQRKLRDADSYRHQHASASQEFGRCVPRALHRRIAVLQYHERDLSLVQAKSVQLSQDPVSKQFVAAAIGPISGEGSKGACRILAARWNQLIQDSFERRTCLANCDAITHASVDDPKIANEREQRTSEFKSLPLKIRRAITSAKKLTSMRAQRDQASASHASLTSMLEALDITMVNDEGDDDVENVADSDEEDSLPSSNIRDYESMLSALTQDEEEVLYRWVCPQRTNRAYCEYSAAKAVQLTLESLRKDVFPLMDLPLESLSTAGAHLLQLLHPTSGRSLVPSTSTLSMTPLHEKSNVASIDLLRKLFKSTSEKSLSCLSEVYLPWLAFPRHDPRAPTQPVHLSVENLRSAMGVEKDDSSTSNPSTSTSGASAPSNSQTLKRGVAYGSFVLQQEENKQL